jgi:hypothetical protein
LLVKAHRPLPLTT